jgi:hypothetical protein
VAIAAGASLLAAGCLISAPALATAAASASPARATSAAASQHPAVVVIGAPDLRWGQLTAAAQPQLWSLLPAAAAGSLSIKAVDPVTCPDDGWLTLGAGNRVTAQDRRGGRCPDAVTLPVTAVGAGAKVPAIASVARHNSALDDGTKVGALGDAATAAGSCVAAAGPGAALAAANSSGQVGRYLADPQVAASDLAFLQACPITVLTGTAADAGALAAGVHATAPAADVLVVGLAQPGTEHAHLEVAIALGPTFAAGRPGAARLDSASTRRAPFVQLVDVAPTLLSISGIAAPSSIIGEPWRSVIGSTSSTGAEVLALNDLDRAAQRQSGAIVPFFLVLVAFMLVSGGVGWMLARRVAHADADHDSPRPSSWRDAPVAIGLCIASALVPAASFTANLAPWWRSDHPLVALFALTAAGVAVGAVFVVLADNLVWRRSPLGPVGGVGVVTAAVIGLDLLTGARLQIFSMAGYSPLVAGRFAGIGNVAFGVFAAGALLAIGALAARQSTPRAMISAVAVPGVIAVALDGGPSWGSDVGGVLALVPTLVLLAGWLSGARVSWRRAALGVLAAVVVVSALGAVDYARPADHQTHLGRFVGKVLHGGAWTILRRKGVADVRLLTHSPLTLLIPLLVIAAIAVLVRPMGVLKRAFEAEPALRPVLAAVLVMSLIGAVVNDSGVVIPALAVLVVLPAAVASVLRAVRPANGG